MSGSEPDHTWVEAAVRPEPSAGDLQHWLEFGGTLRVLQSSPTTVVLAMCRCDGGEQVDQFVSRDPQVLAFVTERCATGDIQA